MWMRFSPSLAVSMSAKLCLLALIIQVASLGDVRGTLCREDGVYAEDCTDGCGSGAVECRHGLP